MFTSRGWFLPASAILRGQNLRYTLWLLVYVYFIDTVDNMHLNISVLADLLAVIVFIAIIVPGLRNSFSPMYNTSSYVPLRGQHHRFIRPLADTKENETPVVVQTSSNTHHLPYQTTWCLSRYNLRNAAA